MTEHLPIMIIAVFVAVLTMLLAADPLARFIHNNPTVVMLALGFLLMIGMTLIAEGFGAHVPKGYIYAAMAFLGLDRGAQHAVAQGGRQGSRLARATSGCANLLARARLRFPRMHAEASHRSRHAEAL